MAENTKQPGIIGQQYEDRKTHKMGVLTERNEKYKTLLMRDADGKEFNINYSTFRSNWRKYTGDEVVQTSTQVEEARVEKQKKQEETKKEVMKESPVKVTTEDKIKAVRAMHDFIDNRISANESSLKTARNTRGAVIVRYGKRTAFEVWPKYALDKYDIYFKGIIADILSDAELQAIKDIEGTEYIEHETWSLRHQFRVTKDMFENMLDTLITVCNKFIEENSTKEENEENEEE